MEYLDRVREVARELMDEREYINARNLYCRILPMFKNMPRKMRDALSEEESAKRLDAHQILLMNIALCHLKCNATIDAVKFAKEAVE
jgi:predicted membrane chloride channel (bestrophin family)